MRNVIIAIVLGCSLLLSAESIAQEKPQKKQAKPNVVKTVKEKKNVAAEKKLKTAKHKPVSCEEECEHTPEQAAKCGHEK